ncbi:MAG: hypothetical protein K0R26_797 [Bacteroidota bacterium]|jgi:hypothetical protein|nr:hypothetical protein [Bacteroidota bacterium]
MLLKLNLNIHKVPNRTIVGTKTAALEEPTNPSCMNTIKTEVANLFYNKECRLLHVKILEDISITVEKAKALCLAIEKITNDEKHFALVDATNYFYIEDEALRFMALPENCSNKLGSAYFSTNLANRLTMHFFKVFHKPLYPIELFKKREEAMKWLLQIQSNNQPCQLN